MLKLNHLLLFTMLQLFFASSVLADLDEVVVTQSIVQFPPYFIVQENGDITGTHANLSRAMFKQAGLKVELIQYPYVRAQYMLSKGEMGIIQFADRGIEEEKNSLYFVIPSLPIAMHAYTIRPDIILKNEPSFFNAKSVAIIRSWPLGPYAKILNEENKDIDLTIISRSEHGVEMLYNNRMDILVFYKAPFDMISKKRGFHHENLRDMVLMSTAGNSFAIPKTYKYAEELHQRLSQAYHVLISQGKIYEQETRLRDDDPAQYIQ